MNAPGLFLLGATHHTAPLAIRERLALAAADVTQLGAELGRLPDLREFAVLNTCNRVEFYGVSAGASAAAQVQAAFCARQRFDPAEFEKISLNLHGREAVRHLIEVASGLDSQMLGETEVMVSSAQPLI